MSKWTDEAILDSAKRLEPTCPGIVGVAERIIKNRRRRNSPDPWERVLQSIIDRERRVMESRMLTGLPPQVFSARWKDNEWRGTDEQVDAFQLELGVIGPVELRARRAFRVAVLARETMRPEFV